MTRCRAPDHNDVVSKKANPTSPNSRLATIPQSSASLPVPIPIPIPILLRILPLPLRDQRLAVILTVRQPVDRVDMTFRRGGVGQEDYARACKKRLSISFTGKGEEK